MKNAKINAVFDKVIATFKLKNDAHLARFLNVAPPVISKMRAGRLLPGASIILSLHENACMDVAEIREMLAEDVVPVQRRVSEKLTQRVSA